MPPAHPTAEADAPTLLRQKAAECRRLAEESRDPRIGDQLAELAEAYLERAGELERGDRKL